MRSNIGFTNGLSTSIWHGDDVKSIPHRGTVDVKYIDVIGFEHEKLGCGLTYHGSFIHKIHVTPILSLASWNPK